MTNDKMQILRRDWERGHQPISKETRGDCQPQPRQSPKSKSHAHPARGCYTSLCIYRWVKDRVGVQHFQYLLKSWRSLSEKICTQRSRTVITDENRILLRGAVEATASLLNSSIKLSVGKNDICSYFHSTMFYLVSIATHLLDRYVASIDDRPQLQAPTIWSATIKYLSSFESSTSSLDSGTTSQEQ
jgi:hypothetical protein